MQLHTLEERELKNRVWLFLLSFIGSPLQLYIQVQNP